MQCAVQVAVQCSIFEVTERINYMIYHLGNKLPALPGMVIGRGSLGTSIVRQRLRGGKAAAGAGRQVQAGRSEQMTCHTHTHITEAKW